MKLHRPKIFTAIGIGILLLFLIAAIVDRDDEKAPAVSPAASAEKAASGSSGAGTAESGRVLAVNIDDPDVLAGEKPLLVTFDGDMVKEPGKTDAMPFALVPAVPGEAAWLTPRSFAFKPSRPFAPGREYRLLFNEDLSDLSGRPVRYFPAFKPEAPTLQEARPGALNAARRVLPVYFSFSQPVDIAAFAAHLSAHDAGSGEALQISVDGKGKSQNPTALVRLGKAGQKLRLDLSPDKEDDARPLGLTRAFTLNLTLDGGLARVTDAQGDSPLAVDGAYSWEDEDGLRALFRLTTPLPVSGVQDGIEVSPDIPYSVDDGGYSLRFAQELVPGGSVRVTLKKGLLDAAGRALAEELSHTLALPEREVSARFAEDGHYLTPLFGSRVALSFINTEEATVTLRRVYDNNLPFMELEPDYRARNLMRDLAVHEVRLPGAERNRPLRRAVDLEALTAGKRGVYLLSVAAKGSRKDANGRSRRDYGEAERLVVLTDIGLSARVFPAGVTVTAASLATAKPLPNAVTRIYSASNQLIARGFTDENGVFVYKGSDLWDSQLAPHMVTVQYGEGSEADISFLPLDYSTNADFQTPDGGADERAYLCGQRAFEAFLFAPRNLYSPGETVQLKAFVRDGAGLPPSPFPALFRILSPRGTETARGTAMLSAEGGADFAFVMPESAPTGPYTALIEMPGQKDGRLGEFAFNIEEFIAPRLEVALAPETPRLTPDREQRIRLSSRYLFGAPAANLEYEAAYRVTAEPFAAEGFEGYSFGDAERPFPAIHEERAFAGELSEAGEATLEFHAPADWPLPPALAKVRLMGGVREAGGRWVWNAADFIYSPADYVLGLKAVTTASGPGKEIVIDVAALDLDGKPAAAPAKDLKAEISLVRGVWHTVRRGGRTSYDFDERVFPVDEKSIVLSEGKASLAFTPESAGQYLIRVSEPDGAAAASLRVRAGGADAAAGRLDRVELSLDRDEYRPGDTARLSVAAPFAGTLYLGVEREGQIRMRTLRLDEAGGLTAHIDIPVTADMAPNASVTALLLRPLAALKKPEADGDDTHAFLPRRAGGSARITLAKAPHALSVKAETPKRALPSAGLVVPFAVTDERGAPVQGEFAVALVDEGILSLSAFATPDPLGFFMSARRMAGGSHDVYDSQLPPESRITPLLVPGGGADAMFARARMQAPGANLQSLFRTRQARLAAFLPTVVTGPDGRGEAHFALPEYSGKGRLMIVGVSGARYAGMEAALPVGRGLELEAAAPQAVAPGDEFELSLNLFAQAEEGAAGSAPPVEAALGIRTEGFLRLLPDGGGEGVERTELRLPVAPGGERQDVSLRVKALDGAGLAALTVSVSAPGPGGTAVSFERRVEIAVRPPYPVIAKSASALVRADAEDPSARLSLPGSWLPGSLDAAFAAGGSPALAALPALELLRDYPYGCLEQIISQAWPWLALPEMQRALFSDRKDAAAEANAAAAISGTVARIGFMQTPQGGFESWPGIGRPDPWRSCYAALFLSLAKKRVPVPEPMAGRALDYLRFVLAAPPESLTPESIRIRPLREGTGSQDATPENEQDAAERLKQERYANSVKAFAALVLTLEGEPPLGWLQTLSARQELMTPSGRIMLAGALALRTGRSAPLRTLDLAAAPVALPPEGETFDLQRLQNAVLGPDIQEPSPTLESALRNQALLLWLWSETDPVAPRALELCEGLSLSLAQRQGSLSSQEAGLAALALGAFAEKTGLDAGDDWKADISGPGGPLATLTRGESLTLTGAELLPDDATEAPDITMRLSGEGSAFAVYSARGVPLAAPAPAARGLALRRTLLDEEGGVLRPDADGRIVLRKGQRVRVLIDLFSEGPVADVAVAEVLAGGLEAENPRLGPARDGDDPAQLRPLHLDIRQDRLLIFPPELAGSGPGAAPAASADGAASTGQETTPPPLPDGAFRFSYTARAVSRGLFALPPAAAEAMYAPQLNAVTGSGVILLVE